MVHHTKLSLVNSMTKVRSSSTAVPAVKESTTSTSVAETLVEPPPVSPPTDAGPDTTFAVIWVASRCHDTSSVSPEEAEAEAEKEADGELVRLVPVPLPPPDDDNGKMVRRLTRTVLGVLATVTAVKVCGLVSMRTTRSSSPATQAVRLSSVGMGLVGTGVGTGVGGMRVLEAVTDVEARTDLESVIDLVAVRPVVNVPVLVLDSVKVVGVVLVSVGEACDVGVAVGVCEAVAVAPEIVAVVAGVTVGVTVGVTAGVAVAVIDWGSVLVAAGVTDCEAVPVEE